MNATPDHLDDEILSALLDGDRDGAVDADAHLRSCDRCAGRQEELAAARAAFVVAPIEPVDELTRRRILAAALQAAGEATAGPAAVPLRARSRWGARHPAVIGSAAAVVLALLVGIPFVAGNDSASRDADTTLAAEAPSGASQESASAFLGDLGDLSDRQSLRLRLTASPLSDTYAYNQPPMEPGASPAGGARSAAPAAAPNPMAGGLAASTTAPYGSQGSSGGSGSAEKATSAPAADTAADAATGNQAPARDDATAGRRDQADTDACVAALLNGPARGGRLTASGTGTFEGRPAIVAVFDLSGGRVAFVADRSGCAVRDQFPV